MRDFSILAVAACSTAVLASAAVSQTIDFNDAPVQPASTMCGSIVTANLYSFQSWFYSSDVFECLQSVPFNDAVATRFVTYLNQTLQFQSTLTRLQTPPSSYQQPAVDLIGGLGTIQTRISSHAYKNQYAFEIDVQKLLYAAHDAHINVYAGIAGSFTFSSPFDIVSVSEDGRQAPKIYFYDDLASCVTQRNCQPSAIEKINDRPAADFLVEFAKNQSVGFLEPHADWNALMRSAALDIQGGLPIFSGGANIYPGDGLNFQFENGSILNEYWISLYNSPGYTGPLTTGGDFYNFFVLDLAPASYNATQYYSDIGDDDDDDNDDDGDSDSASANLTSWNSVTSAYPKDALVWQDELGLYQPGIVTGYLLEDISTAVLSLPTFSEYGSGIDTFSSTIAQFINKTSSADKVVIDLQQNSGGLVGLAFEAFRQFFPTLVPYAGSRMRASSMADMIGQSLSGYFANLTSHHDDDYREFLASEWTALRRIDAQTDERFTSWSQFFGPLLESGSLSTLTQRYNLTDDEFIRAAFGVVFPKNAFNPHANQKPIPWAGEDIVILTDGLCSSACALFVEMMTAVEGVRTVVVGGAPQSGPMQAVAGTRGAMMYSSAQLDGDITAAREIDPAGAASLPVRGDATDTGVSITYAGFNLRDQIRQDTDIPTQFLYLPADCRIYWTMANFFDYERLWRDTYSAIYNDTSLCVPGSTNAQAPASNKISARDIAARGSSISSYILSGVGGTEEDIHLELQPILDNKPLPPAKAPRSCVNAKGEQDQSLCKGGLQCLPVETICETCDFQDAEGRCVNPKLHKSKPTFQCLSRCKSGQGSRCPTSTDCILDKPRNSRQVLASTHRTVGAHPTSHDGTCYPDDSAQSKSQRTRKCKSTEQ